jgi:hypothetical protein
VEIKFGNQIQEKVVAFRSDQEKETQFGNIFFGEFKILKLYSEGQESQSRIC